MELPRQSNDVLLKSLSKQSVDKTRMSLILTMVKQITIVTNTFQYYVESSKYRVELEYSKVFMKFWGNVKVFLSIRHHDGRIR